MDTPPPITPEPLPPASPSGPSTKQWKVILHVSGLAVFILPFAGNIFAPLIIWLLKKDTNPELDAEGRKVLNFQISYTIYMVAAGILAVFAGCLLVPYIFPPIVGIAWLVFTIIGTVKASNGENYEFPFTLKLL